MKYSVKGHMHRIQTTPDIYKIYLGSAGALVISVAIIVFTGLVTVPYEVGIAMIIGGLAMVYVGLSRLFRELDGRRVEK